MGLKQPIWCGGSLISANTTFYIAPYVVLGVGTSETNNTTILDAAVTLRNLRVVLSAAPGGTATRVFTMRKNGSNQTLACSFGAADTTITDSSNSFSLAAGDTLTIQQTATNTPAACNFAIVYEQETADTVTSVYGFAGGALGTGATPIYAPLFSAMGGWTTNADRAQAVAGVGGVVGGYRVRLTASPGSGKSRTFILDKNGTAQDGTGGTPDTTITISDAATTGNASFSLTVAATDLLRIKETASGTPTNANCLGTHTFTAAVTGRMVFCANPNDAPSSSATEYAYAVGGAGNFDATESARELPGPVTAVAVSGLYVFLETAVSGGASQAYTLRKNGGDTAQTVSIAAGNATGGPSAGAQVTLSSGDLFSMKCVVSGTTNNTPHLAFLMTDPTAAAGKKFRPLMVSP